MYEASDAPGAEGLREPPLFQRKVRDSTEHSSCFAFVTTREHDLVVVPRVGKLEFHCLRSLRTVDVRESDSSADDASKNAVMDNNAAGSAVKKDIARGNGRSAEEAREAEGGKGAGRGGGRKGASNSNRSSRQVAEPMTIATGSGESVAEIDIATSAAFGTVIACAFFSGCVSLVSFERGVMMTMLNPGEAAARALSPSCVLLSLGDATHATRILYGDCDSETVSVIEHIPNSDGAFATVAVVASLGVPKAASLQNGHLVIVGSEGMRVRDWEMMQVSEQFSYVRFCLALF